MSHSTRLLEVLFLLQLTSYDVYVRAVVSTGSTDLLIPL